MSYFINNEDTPTATLEQPSEKWYVENPKKICPMLFTDTAGVPCQERACAWWDGKYNRCAITSMAFKK